MTIVKSVAASSSTGPASSPRSRGPRPRRGHPLPEQQAERDDDQGAARGCGRTRAAARHRVERPSPALEQEHRAGARQRRADARSRRRARRRAGPATRGLSSGRSPPQPQVSGHQRRSSSDGEPASGRGWSTAKTSARRRGRRRRSGWRRTPPRPAPARSRRRGPRRCGPAARGSASPPAGHSVGRSRSPRAPRAGSAPRHDERRRRSQRADAEAGASRATSSGHPASRHAFGPPPTLGRLAAAPRQCGNPAITARADAGASSRRWRTPRRGCPGGAPRAAPRPGVRRSAGRRGRAG